MVDRSVGRTPVLDKPWEEVVPDLREFLTKLAQIVSDPDTSTSDLSLAVAWFTGSSFAGASGGWLGGGITDGDKGDISVTVGGSVWTIDNDVVSNAKLADMAQSTIKGRAAGAGTGDPTDLTATQATAILDDFEGDSGSGGVKGLVPAPAAGDTLADKFLKADGAWVRPLGAYFKSSTTLANATPTPLFTIPVPSGGFSCGRATITVQIDDGTDFEAATQILDYAVVNKAGTLTRTLTALGLASAFSTGAGMALAYDTTTGTNEFTIRLQATAGIAPVTLLATWEVLDVTGNQPEVP